MRLDTAYLDPNNPRLITGTPQEQEQARREVARQREVQAIMKRIDREIPRSDLIFGRWVEVASTGELFHPWGGTCGSRPREAGIIGLLGIVSAHFDIAQTAEVEGDVLGRVVTKLNAGIAVVTPAHAIRELIDREDVVAERERYQEQAQDQIEPAATYDYVPDDDLELEALARRAEGDEER